MVLIIDDEPIVLESIGLMLKCDDCSSLEYNDTKEAIEFYKKNSKGICVVIIDICMPDMNGKECYDILKEINPNIKCIITTGHNAIEKKEELGIDAPFLQKPFGIDDLKKAIHLATRKVV